MATATYQMFLPESFDFTKREEWLKWLRRFERFRQASGLAEKSEETQVNTPVYCMVDIANDIHRSFEQTGEYSKKYEAVQH